MADILDAICNVVELALRKNNYLANVGLQRDYSRLSLTLQLHVGNDEYSSDDGSNNRFLDTKPNLEPEREFKHIPEMDDPSENSLPSQPSFVEMPSSFAVKVESDENVDIPDLQVYATKPLDNEQKEEPNFQPASDSTESGFLRSPKGMRTSCKQNKPKTARSRKRKSPKKALAAPQSLPDLKNKKETKKKRERENLTKFVCNICGQRSAYANRHAKHLRTHSTEKPLACSLCDFRTKEDANLRRHMLTHTGERPYKCDLCAKDFACKSTLRTHQMGFHGTEKKHSCRFCEYKAKIMSQVRRHERRMHTAPTTVYRCDQCSMRTMDKKKYENHMLAHESNISFNCQCGLKYTNKSDYDRHVKRAHGPEKKEKKKYKVPPSVCRICGRSYAMTTGLKKHRDRHHPGELFHHCSHCSFSTDIKAEFVRHLSNLTHLERLSNGCEK